MNPKKTEETRFYFFRMSIFDQEISSPNKSIQPYQILVTFCMLSDSSYK